MVTWLWSEWWPSFVDDLSDSDHVDVAAWADESDRLSLDRGRGWQFLCNGFAVLWLQLLYDNFKFVPLLGMIEAVGSDLLEALGQDVL